MVRIDFLDESLHEAKPDYCCVVRIRTTMWSDRRGVYIKKELTYLRKQSEGFNILKEDLDALSSKDVVMRILNLDECEDGVYKVVFCNESRDYETGFIDDYDYRLVKFCPAPEQIPIEPIGR